MPAEEHDASLQALRQLIETQRWDIVGTLTQKLQQSELVKTPRKAESVVFDHELTPTQANNIREATGVEVYDRPAVILEIFRRHARTKEAQLQVQLAKLKYLAPRERVSGAKERKGGGRGARGRRVLSRDRAPGSAGPNQRAERELKAIHREQIERRRHREGLPKVAIVGYTNAGKSSLMRAITSSEVFVAVSLANCYFG